MRTFGQAELTRDTKACLKCQEIASWRWEACETPWQELQREWKHERWLGVTFKPPPKQVSVVLGCTCAASHQILYVLWASFSVRERGCLGRQVIILIVLYLFHHLPPPFGSRAEG